MFAGDDDGSVVEEGQKQGLPDIPEFSRRRYVPGPERAGPNAAAAGSVRIPVHLDPEAGGNREGAYYVGIASGHTITNRIVALLA